MRASAWEEKRTNAERMNVVIVRILDSDDKAKEMEV